MKLLVGTLLCVLVSSTAFGQSGFVQGSFAREIKRFSGEPGEAVYDATTNGGVVGGAGFLAPHWTVGLELDLGGTSTTRRSATVTISGRPTTVNTDYSIRRRSVSALVGYHTAPRRVRLGYYAGWSFSRVRREIASDAPPIVLTEPSEPTVFDDRPAGFVLGVDAVIEIVPHVAVVPSLRAQGLKLSGDLDGQSFRPGIGARVSF
jgi:hypothetical protein